MPYEVEVSDEFRDWYEPLSEAEQLSVEKVVLMLEEAGPALGFPYSSGTAAGNLNTGRLSRTYSLNVETQLGEMRNLRPDRLPNRS